MATSQVNARLDTDLKRRGDAVLAQAGASATDAIRSLWAYLDKTKGLPDFMSQPHAELTSGNTQLADKGRGMALALARQRGLVSTTWAGDVSEASYDELRDLAFDEMVQEGKLRV